MTFNSGGLPSTSRATLIDSISRGFSYPVADFYSDLVDGSFLQTLQQECSGSSVDILPEIETGIEQITAADRGREELESEYIELFEHNHRQEPLHLYCGLYLQGEGGRLETLQRLTRLYRSYGLDMEDGAENADHITVVLEFLSFLYKQADDLQSNDDQSDQKQIATDIRIIIRQLEWTKRLETELVNRGSHPFYLPLSRLLRAIL